MMDSTIGRPALEIENLVYRYPDATAGVSEFALSILSFSAETRSITVLTGENGSGKTTLLKILAGLIEPSSGSIQGSDCVLVHQEPYLLHGSVEKNVAYGLRVRRMPSEERKARVASCLDAVGLAGFGRRRADRLSGGERQRVALARALAVRPEVLLLDEPTASVDARSVGRLEEIIAGIVAGGTTMVITSHDVVFSYRVADTIVCLDHGTMVATEVNVLKGRISGSDERFSYFATGSVEIRCTIQRGDFRSAVIPYDDVILSAGTIDSSAQNQFRGVVTAVVPSGGRFRVDVDCGFLLSSVVTGYSIEKLGVSIGAELYVIFKASAMRVY